MPERRERGYFIWSPVGASYLLRAAGFLAIVDVATGSERVVMAPDELDSIAWLPDGRTIALWGSGMGLVDTLAPTPALERVYEGRVNEAFFSDDGRYVVFVSNGGLLALDVGTRSVEAVEGSGEPRYPTKWFRSDWFGWSTPPESFFLDLTQRPLVAVPFGDGN